MVRTADSGVIATINQIDPIYVAFAIPQVGLGPLRAAMAKGPVTVEAPSSAGPSAAPSPSSRTPSMPSPAR